MITGYEVTTQVINKIIVEQSEYRTITKSAPPEIKGGVTIYGTTRRVREPLHKDLVRSLEKWREYIHKKYFNVELTKTQVEDIFRFLCSDIYWRILVNNKKESELLHKVILDLVIPIEDMTHSNGVYDKIIEEMENQCLFPKLSTHNKK